jgi:uncharacterized membrane protein
MSPPPPSLPPAQQSRAPAPYPPADAGHGAGLGAAGRQAGARQEPIRTSSRSRRQRLGAVLGWMGVAACGFYGGFGVYAAVTELLYLAGLLEVSRSRAAPPLFVLHALTGSIALIAGALQLRLASRLLRSRPQVHRALGRSYVLATWVTSAAGLATAAFFDVGWPAKMVFAAWAVAWSAATVIALRRARARRFAQHRQWMVRSFALALVFMTFDVVRSALASMSLPRTTVYAAGLLLTAIVSLALAELWIRTRAKPRIPGAS